VLILTGCTTLKRIAVWTHDAIDDHLAETTNTTSEATATNASGGTAEEPATNTAAYAKPASVAVDWTAKTLTPTGMGAGEIGTMTIIGRMADGRTGALDWPAWDATTGLWRIGMMTPVPGSNPAAELRGGDRNAPVIFKQSL
jgi:hypothetical protein